MNKFISFLNKKFLLMFISYSFLLSSCNMGYAFFDFSETKKSEKSSSFFGFGKKPKRSPGISSIIGDALSGVLTAVVFLGAAVGLGYLIFGGKKDDKGQTPNNPDGPPLEPKKDGVDQKPNNEAIEKEKKDKKAKIGSMIIPASKVSQDETKKAEDKKEEPKQVANISQQRVLDVLDFAIEKGILMDGSHSFEIDKGNGAKVKNNVFQLSVAPQFKNRSGNTCGPRALFNAQVLTELFNFDQASNNFVNNIDRLLVLKDLENGDINPRLAEYFKAMHGSIEKAVKRDNKDKVVLGQDGKAIYEDVRIFRNLDFDKEKGAPKNCEEYELRKFIEYCKNINKNTGFNFDSVNLMPGYDECFDNDHGERKEYIDFLKDKAIGYCEGFAVMQGRQESDHDHMSNSGKESEGITHWTTIFVIKTGDNEYNWIVTDSMNSRGYANSHQVKAYIHKMCGSKLESYEQDIKKRINNRARPGQIEALREIKENILRFKFVNKANKTGDAIKISQDAWENGVRGADGDTYAKKMESFFRIFKNRIDDQFAIDEKEREDLKNELDQLKQNLGLNDSLTDDKFEVCLNEDIIKEKTEIKNKVVRAREKAQVAQEFLNWKNNSERFYARFLAIFGIKKQIDPIKFDKDRKELITKLEEEEKELEPLYLDDMDQMRDKADKENIAVNILRLKDDLAKARLAAQ